MARAGGFYSRMVAVLKIGLPLMALVMLASMFLVTMEDEFEGGIVFGEADLAALGEGLRVVAPVLTGATRAEDPFRFTAEVVVPDAAPPTRAEITRLEGRVDFLGGPSVDVAAPEAALDLQAQRMVLTGRVTLQSDDGYDLVADRMEIDLVTGVMTATGRVDGAGPMGTIASQTLEVVPARGDAGRRVFSFGNGVRLVYLGGHESDP